MNAKELVERARAMTELPSHYRLGGGKTAPAGAHPLDGGGTCDCSAFVMWCLGIPKPSGLTWLKKLNGGWYNTDGIFVDAVREPTGMFTRLDAPRPGAIVVYPSRAVAQNPQQPKVGHVGIVSEVDATGIARVVHCSKGNDTKLGRAIAETGPAVFATPPLSAIAWCEVVD